MTGAIKKSLFEILRDDLVDANVLDIYCGTGTLGLEALSRGAQCVLFADRDRRVLHRLRRFAAEVGAERHCTLRCGDVTSRLRGWLSGWGKPVDVAFVDPPFASTRQTDWDAVCERLLTALAKHLAEDGRVVLRLPKGVDAPEQAGGLTRTRVKQYGGMAVAWYAGRESE